MTERFLFVQVSLSFSIITTIHFIIFQNKVLIFILESWKYVEFLEILLIISNKKTDELYNKINVDSIDKPDGLFNQVPSFAILSALSLSWYVLVSRNPY